MTLRIKHGKRRAPAVDEQRLEQLANYRAALFQMSLATFRRFNKKSRGESTVVMPMLFDEMLQEMKEAAQEIVGLPVKHVKCEHRSVAGDWRSGTIVVCYYVDTSSQGLGELVFRIELIKQALYEEST